MRTKQLVHEAYAAHNVLTNLGFEPAEVFVGTPYILNGDPPGNYAAVALRRGGKEFVYNFARLDSVEDGERFLAAFSAFSARQPLMSRAALTRITNASNIWRQRHRLIEGLLLKGFELPYEKKVAN